MMCMGRSWIVRYDMISDTHGIRYYNDILVVFDMISDTRVSDTTSIYYSSDTSPLYPDHAYAHDNNIRYERYLLMTSFC